MENSMDAPQKVKNRTTVRSSNPIFVYIFKRMENRILKRYLHSHVHCSIIHNSKEVFAVLGWVASVVSSSLRSCGQQPASLLCSQDSPGKNTGVGFHALLQGIFLTQESNPRILQLLHTAGRFFTTDTGEAQQRSLIT